MMKKLTYIALGANLGSPKTALHFALSSLRRHSAVSDLRCSSIYHTSPVSSIPQPYYLNAVCQFYTNLTSEALFCELQLLERLMGQSPKKSSELPRYLDLDILFFGEEAIKSSSLEIPHPRWRERLFVLIPLRDLVKEIILPNGQILELDGMIADLQKLNREEVSLYEA